MGEVQTPHFYDFGIFEPVAKLQIQLILFLETLGHLTNQEESPEHFKHISKTKTRFVEIFGKDGRRQMMTIRLTNLKRLGYEINICPKKPEMAI